MSKILIRLLFSIGLLWPQLLLSQNLNQVLEIANRHAENKDYFAADQVYQAALNIDSSNAEVLYRHGLNLTKLNNPNGASRYLYKSYLIEGDKVHAELSYVLAESYRNAGEYRKAKRYYSKAIRPYRRDKKSYWYKRISQSKKAASWADKEAKKKTTGKIENLSVSGNSEASEFSGILHENVLYFSALRSDSMSPNGAILDPNYWNALYRMDIDSKLNATQIPIDAGGKFKNKHLANLRFGKGESVYFSVCDSNYLCEIWTGNYVDKQITGVEKLNSNINASGFNNTQGYWFMQDDEEYLLFVSNRKRGFGGLDLWLSKKADFGFEAPKNLGANINSADDEISPFYNPKNKNLYFSSNWHIGFGGYDLFQAKGAILSLSKPVNMQKPINSAQDEYYFFPAEKKAILSSNRSIGNVDQSANCCNDLFVLPFEEDPWEETDPEEIEVSVDVLNQYLPLDLYFHNDSPDPKSTDTSSSENYLNLAIDYALMQEEYVEKYESIFPDSTKDEETFRLEAFFENDLNDGIESLQFFSPLLLRELKKGSQIELTIKGYASSLSNSDYNLKLTLRRIESLINYLAAYEGGVFEPYLNHSAKDGGKLSIQKLPFGEFAVENTAIEKNRITAIYSPEAARQRKIEVLAVTQNQDKITNFDGSAVEDKAILSLDKSQYNLGEIPASKKFVLPIQNTGNKTLRLFNVNANCDCVELKYPKSIAPGEKANVQVLIDAKELHGKVKLTLSIFSNTEPNINAFSINFKRP